LVNILIAVSNRNALIDPIPYIYKSGL
jgi:hypothetical protein